MTSLVKKIDQRLNGAAGKGPRLPGVFVLCDSKGSGHGLDQRLRAMAEKEALKRVNLCIGTAPDDYQLANEAEVTVVIYNVDRRGRQHVKANFALRKGGLDASTIDAIVKALSDVLPPRIQTVVTTSKETQHGGLPE
ncbi:MAG: hypothetical protein L0Y71_15410 [Gemmataceae bacterium]|nr:hypothetical protein [Gemmataceae bacterium]